MNPLQRLKRNEDGNFTMEATLIFPILLILVLLFIFFSLVIYEKVSLQYKANQIASRLAYTWTSSTMNYVTGEMTEEDYTTVNEDGLYWRLTSNNFLGNFGLGDSGTVQKKIARAGEINGEIDFRNGYFVQEIEVSLDKQLSLPPYVANLFGINKVAATARHPVVEPVEIIRNTDFMIYGYEKFTKYAGEYLPFFGNK